MASTPREVLREYGFDDKQIEALESEGAIVAAASRKAGQQVA